MRTTPRLISILSVSVALMAAGGTLQQSVASVVSTPLVESSQYVVRPDPRLCPSPLCGGYWVALANRSRTRCSDGALRPRCYVARALDEDRHPLATGLPDGALVRADIEPWTFEGFGELGALIVADVRTPVGEGTKGTYYRVRDLGIRCVRAPCFSFRASRLNGSFRTTVSSVALPAGLTAKELARARAALATREGLFVLGRIVEASDSGRVLQASRIYFRAAKPRG